MQYISPVFRKALLLFAVGVANVCAQPASDGRSLIFYFDAASMSKEDRTRAISAAETYIQRNTQAQDRVGVMVSSADGVAVRQDLTTDRNRVLEAVRRVADNPAGSGGQIRPAEMNRVMNFLEPMAGAKAVVCFTAGSGPAADDAGMKPLRDRAANSQVKIYFIDTRGVPAH